MPDKGRYTASLIPLLRNTLSMSLVKPGTFPLPLRCLPARFSKTEEGDKQIVENLKQHIYYLADDKLEGRRAGSNGEKLAVNYISDQFKAIGLAPKGTDGYLQSLRHQRRKRNRGLPVVNSVRRPSRPAKNFSLAFSASKAVKPPGYRPPGSHMPWFVDLAEILEENKTNPHFDLEDYIRKNAKKAADRGATAILLYNTSGNPG